MNKTTPVQCTIKYIDCSGEFNANKILRKISPQHTLLKLQNAKFNLVKFEHLYSFAKQLRDDQNLMGLRIALHCPSEVQFGMGRVMQTLVKNGASRLQLKCFRNLRYATSWLIQ